MGFKAVIRASLAPQNKAVSDARDRMAAAEVRCVLMVFPRSIRCSEAPRNRAGLAPPCCYSCRCYGILKLVAYIVVFGYLFARLTPVASVTAVSLSFYFGCRRAR